MASRSTAQIPFAVYFCAALAAIVAGLLYQDWANTGRTLLDTDDAMRLTQMRDWRGGQGWFDLHQHRVAPPYGFDSHWSRLIDAGLAGLFSFFKLFADDAFAERLMRAVWPLLWLVPTLAGMVAIAWRIAGREAALVALLLALAGVPAYQQFGPGRIDHHNVQIALTLLVAAATVWSDRVRWCAGTAGVLTGLALAVGFENLPYLACCGAAFALRYVFDAKGALPLRHYCIALALSAGMAFFVSIPPGHWVARYCDGIAINTVAPIIFACIVFVLGSVMSGTLLSRAASVAIAGAGAALIFATAEPACMGGPFAKVDSGLWPIWLSDVREMQPLFTLFRKSPLTAAGIATFPAAAVVATLLLARETSLRGDFGFLAAAAVFLFAAAVTIAAIRGYSYAIWLGMPLVAALALRFFAVLKLHTIPARVIAGLLLAPPVVSSGAIGIAMAAGLSDKEDFSRPESRHCLQSRNVAALAQLPKGLIAADVSFGPYIVALTPHSVMSAPYHWESAGMIASHRAFASPPQEAHDILRRWKVTYVVMCGPRPPVGLSGAQREASLWAALTEGRVPPWLTRVTPGNVAFTAYRVAP